MKFFYCGKQKQRSFSFFLFVLLSFAAISCTKKSSIDILGIWEASITYEQELSYTENDDIPLGAAVIKQENSFTFKDDGTYSRTVKTSFVRAKSFSKEINENDISALYKNFDSEALLLGKYELKGENLTLITERIQTQDEKAPISYEEFYEKMNAYGLPLTKTKISVNDENTITVQGIRLRRF